MRFARAISIILCLGMTSGVAAARDQAVGQYLARLGVPPATTAAAVVCHGFGCRFRTSVPLSDADVRALRRILDKGRKSADAELDAIAAAVAWFERRIGPLTGTSRRTPRAGPAQAGVRSEADCVDETINTTQLLLLVSELRLLRHHEVVGPESRGYLLDGRYPHNTAVVAALDSGERWAIDPWPRRNGERPDVIPIERWLDGG